MIVKLGRDIRVHNQNLFNSQMESIYLMELDNKEVFIVSIKFENCGFIKGGDLYLDLEKIYNNVVKLYNKYYSDKLINMDNCYYFISLDSNNNIYYPEEYKKYAYRNVKGGDINLITYEELIIKRMLE